MLRSETLKTLNRKSLDFAFEPLPSILRPDNHDTDDSLPAIRPNFFFRPLQDKPQNPIIESLSVYKERRNQRRVVSAGLSASLLSSTRNGDIPKIEEAKGERKEDGLEDAKDLSTNGLWLLVGGPSCEEASTKVRTTNFIHSLQTN